MRGNVIYESFNWVSKHKRWSYGAISCNDGKDFCLPGRTSSGQVSCMKGQWNNRQAFLLVTPKPHIRNAMKWGKSDIKLKCWFQDFRLLARVNNEYCILDNRQWSFCSQQWIQEKCQSATYQWFREHFIFSFLVGNNDSLRRRFAFLSLSRSIILGDKRAANCPL